MKLSAPHATLEHAVLTGYLSIAVLGQNVIAQIQHSCFI